MILGIILFVLFIKGINKMYKKAARRYYSALAQYLYEINRAANRG